MAYNLSKGQKDLLSWLVGFPDDVLFITRMNTSCWVNKEEIEIKHVPEMLTITGLKSLESKELILNYTHGTYTELKSYPSFPDWEVTLLQEARALVANDFQETAVSSESLSGGIEVSQELRILLNAMDKRFSEGEIRNMILGWIDYENLSGQNKVERIRSLIERAQRTDHLLYLLSLVISESPEMNWVERFSK